MSLVSLGNDEVRRGDRHACGTGDGTGSTGWPATSSWRASMNEVDELSVSESCRLGSSPGSSLHRAIPEHEQSPSEERRRYEAASPR
jgi:hypothetical protein